jgi:hypothetical protein
MVAQRAAHEVQIVVEQAPRSRSLQGRHRQRMADRVVQLACQPVALSQLPCLGSSAAIRPAGDGPSSPSATSPPVTRCSANHSADRTLSPGQPAVPAARRRIGQVDAKQPADRHDLQSLVPAETPGRPRSPRWPPAAAPSPHAHPPGWSASARTRRRAARRAARSHRRAAGRCRADRSSPAPAEQLPRSSSDHDNHQGERPCRVSEAKR